MKFMLFIWCWCSISAPYTMNSFFSLFSKSVRSIVKSDRVIILDAAALLADENSKVRQIYSRDLLHLNDNGYTILNNELSKILTYQVR